MWLRSTSAPTIRAWHMPPALRSIAGREPSMSRAEAIRLLLPAPRPFDLIPEAKVFAGEWIWDRLAAMDGEPLLVVFATAGGFLLLVVGCRFPLQADRLAPRERAPGDGWAWPAS